jgi:lipopolysaccharide transport system permease protein
MNKPSLNLSSLAQSIFQNRQLLWELSKRDAWGRYKQSYLGILWAFVVPLMLLFVYQFVFGEIFKSKWSSSSGNATAGLHSRYEFALVLFVGLMLFNFFSECINRAPTAVLSNPNYVKKIIFPLELLPVVILVSSLTHLTVSFFLFSVAHVMVTGYLGLEILLFPLVLAPFVVMVIALLYLFSALGVYLRDIAQLTGLLSMILMFLAPIFYPVTAVPEHMRWLMHLNPLTLPVEAARDVLLFSSIPDASALGLYLVISLSLLTLTFAFFQAARRGFADVL